MLSGVGCDIISKSALSFVSCIQLDPSSCCIEKPFIFNIQRFDLRFVPDVILLKQEITTRYSK